MGELRLLEQAWSLAAASPANARGQRLAYYAFTYRHHHFVGERPWQLRWEKIRRAVDFEGKSVLELGCNMGLLSSFSLLHGARAASGVDADATIIRLAAMIAEALGLDAKFRCIGLATNERWDDDLAGADIVTAMSLYNWLDASTRLRLLKFLGRHEELLYEGHDELSVETERLRSAGFEQIDSPSARRSEGDCCCTRKSAANQQSVDRLNGAGIAQRCRVGAGC